MGTQNRAFLEMLKPAKERLEGRPPEEIAENAQIEFQKEKRAFHLYSLGKKITIQYPEYDVAPKLGEWHHLLVLHYMDLADGTPLNGALIPFGKLKSGMVRGGGFDQECEDTIRRTVGKKDPEEVQKACRELGARILPSNADLCAVFPLFPLYPVTLKIWFADEEFEASGRMFLDGAADHYLTVEDAVTAGELILRKLADCGKVQETQH